MISYFTSTINQDANSTVIKTVPLASDNKNYTLANLEPNTNSKQKVEEEDNLTLDGVEEIAQEITSKKKVIKKKIIKKIIKRKNPDGTDAPPEITTIVVEREEIAPSIGGGGNSRAKRNNPSDLESMTMQASTIQSMQLQTMKQLPSPGVTGLNCEEVTQSKVENLQPAQNSIRPDGVEVAPKKRVVKKIIKKKKVNGELQTTQVVQQ